MNIIKIECEYCKREFNKSIYEVKRKQRLGKPMYCSLACGSKHVAEKKKIKLNNEIEYFKNPNVCKQCGQKLSYEKRKNLFCSQSCSATFNEKIKSEKCEKKKCIVCNKPLNGGKMYCSSQCCYTAKTKTTELKIINGEKIYHSSIKKYLIKIRGNKCEECGWNKVNPKSGKCTVQMEHVDGNAENNSLSNLKLLCPNCHSLTPTFGALNRGNGRVWRYKNNNAS
jgi:hypothetical protein